MSQPANPWCATAAVPSKGLVATSLHNSSSSSSPARRGCQVSIPSAPDSTPGSSCSSPARGHTIMAGRRASLEAWGPPSPSSSTAPRRSSMELSARCSTPSSPNCQGQAPSSGALTSPSAEGSGGRQRRRSSYVQLQEVAPGRSLMAEAEALEHLYCLNKEGKRLATEPLNVLFKDGSNGSFTMGSGRSGSFSMAGLPRSGSLVHATSAHVLQQDTDGTESPKGPPSSGNLTRLAAATSKGDMRRGATAAVATGGAVPAAGDTAGVQPSAAGDAGAAPARGKVVIKQTMTDRLLAKFHEVMRN